MRRVSAVVGILALGATLPALADNHTPTTVVTVDQDSFSTTPLSSADWSQTYDAERSAGVAEMVAGPRTPAMGSGSLRLTATATDQLTTVTAKGFSSLKLGAITGASYSTYVDEDSQDGPSQISLKIGMPDTTIVYEPYIAYGNAPASVQGTWQKWDTLAGGNGKGWWLTRNHSVCGQAAPCSFDEIKAELGADTNLVDVKVGIGSGLSNFDGNVDDIDLTIGGWRTRFNFESNKAGDDVVTRVDENSTGGWTTEGEAGTGATDPADNAYSVTYVEGPGLPGQSGLGAVQLKHGGTGAYSAIVQNYAEGQLDATQQYLGSLDNVYLQTYRTSGNEYPGMRFEVRLPDPQTQFAFTTIYSGAVGGSGAINKTDAIHGATTADSNDWYVSRSIAGLTAGTPYTWAQIMRSALNDAVIMKAMVAAGRSGGPAVFTGGVDLLRFEYRDGSSETWDFEKAGVFATTTTTEAPTTTIDPNAPTTTTVARDVYGPQTAFTTEDLTTFLPGEEVKLEGTAFDAMSGVDKIGVEFVDPMGLLTVGYFGTCTGCAAGPNNSVTWSVIPTEPLLPGVYTATAYGHDKAGNVGVSNPITIIIAG